MRRDFDNLCNDAGINLRFLLCLYSKITSRHGVLQRFNTSDASKLYDWIMHV